MTSLLEFHAFLLSNTGSRLDRFASERQRRLASFQ